MDVVQVDIGDGGATAGLASRTGIGIVLLDDDAVVGNTGHGDVRVRDVVDLAAGRVCVGLDTDCVCRVHDRVSLDHDTIHNRSGLDGTLYVQWIGMLLVSTHLWIHVVSGEMNKTYLEFHLRSKYRDHLRSSCR